MRHNVNTIPYTGHFVYTSRPVAWHAGHTKGEVTFWRCFWKTWKMIIFGGVWRCFWKTWKMIFFRNLKVFLEHLEDDFFRTFVSSPSEHRPKPQPTPPRKSPGNFFRHIFHGRILHINNIRKDGIEICTGLLTEEIRAWRDWEVLDEGVEGNLTMHLEEVLPSCKGKQGLTFKRHQGPVAILCHGGLPESGPINRPLMQTITW